MLETPQISSKQWGYMQKMQMEQKKEAEESSSTTAGQEKARESVSISGPIQDSTQEKIEEAELLLVDCWEAEQVEGVEGIFSWGTGEDVWNG